MLNTVCKLHCTQYDCFDAVPKIAQANCQMLINESLTFIQKTGRNLSAWYLRLLCVGLVLITGRMWSFLDSRLRWRKVLGTAMTYISWSSLTLSQVTGRRDVLPYYSSLSSSFCLLWYFQVTGHAWSSKLR